MVISYKYLAKNKAEMDYSDLRKNWVNVFNLSFCTNDIKFNKEALLNKIDEANKM
jgi:cbb3-type cytochrome oxidase cytochrome c subunit